MHSFFLLLLLALVAATATAKPNPEQYDGNNFPEGADGWYDSESEDFPSQIDSRLFQCDANGGLCCTGDDHGNDAVEYGPVPDYLANKNTPYMFGCNAGSLFHSTVCCGLGSKWT